MKCQILFSGKNKKNISVCRLLKILSRVLSVNANWKTCIFVTTDSRLVLNKHCVLGGSHHLPSSKESHSVFLCYSLRLASQKTIYCLVVVCLAYEYLL